MVMGVVEIATVLSLFLPPSSLGSLPSFILHLFFHFYPTCGQLMVYPNTCPINPL